MQKELLDWFKQAQRPLPWRKDYSPYAVWISEVMLQQTQVKTMLPYYERWMQALPNVQALAEVDDNTLFKLWEGLGYYSRARNLKKAAQKVLELGAFPQDYEGLLQLPGVGPYTAAAICSIAFEQDHAVADGNVLRVLARFTGFEQDPKKHMGHFWSLAQSLLPLGEARAFNQAMMELGALVCTPKKPVCSSCPLRAECSAFTQGRTEELPVKSLRTKTQAIQVSLAVLRRGDMVFIQKRPEHGLMAGLWEFPGGKVEAGETPEMALHREIREELGVDLTQVSPLLRLGHAYTKFKVDLHCFEAEPVGEPQASEGRWVKVEDLRGYPFPAANVKLIQHLIVRLGFLCYTYEI